MAVGLDIYERASTTWDREEGFTAKGMKVQTHGPPVLVYFLFFYLGHPSGYLVFWEDRK